MNIPGVWYARISFKLLASGYTEGREAPGAGIPLPCKNPACQIQVACCSSRCVSPVHKGETRLCELHPFNSFQASLSEASSILGNDYGTRAN